MSNAKSYNAEDLVGTRFGRYHILKHISSGGFANVYCVENAQGDMLALKVPIKNERRDGQESILKEYIVYKKIKGTIELPWVSEVKLVRCGEFRCLKMPLLGNSLEKVSKTLTLPLKIAISIRLIEAIKEVHASGYIHKDLTPNNIMLSLVEKPDTSGDASLQLSIIDFGLAKPYLKRNGEHIEYKENQRFEGTWSYCSLHSHKHIINSRRDDMESLFYILIYLFKGSLPWQHTRHKDKRKRSKLIMAQKEQITLEELTAGFPILLRIGTYIKHLSFEERPKYSALIKELNKMDLQ